MIKIKKTNISTINSACHELAKGSLIAFPTETVYGLGADATNDTAVAKIFSNKERPSFNPLIVHISSIDQAKKISILAKYNKLNCEACDFNFNEFYGERGNGYIECHHLLPVSQMSINHKTKLDDLCLLCSNCHRIIHRKTPWLTLKELKAIIKK
jgi:hypothetical protein